jgi:hypothetical protein
LTANKEYPKKESNRLRQFDSFFVSDIAILLYKSDALGFARFGYSGGTGRIAYG